MSNLRLPSAVPGLKATSLTVSRWRVEPGRPFARGTALVELESEDSIIQLEAPADGVLGTILIAAGKTVALGTDLAQLSTQNNAGAATAVSPSQGVPRMASQPSSGKVTPILMPQAGNSMEEGKILQWKVKPGDRITVGQVICEIETDKASIEFESTDAGRLSKIVAPEGSVVAVKQPIAYLAENDADVDAPAASAPAAPTAAAPKPATRPAGGAVTPILMPQAGNSMEEGTIIKWNVKPGDMIKLGQLIFEIDTDKASVEVEATAAGRLARIVADAGAVVPVKQPVGFIADNDADVDAYLAAGGGPAPVAVTATSAPAVAEIVSTHAPAPALARNGGRLRVSPAARKMAADKSLDLSTIGAGSGPGGRILTGDLARAGTSTASRPAAAAATSAGGIIRRPLSKMRKAIATNLQVSKQTVPHFYVTQTINADPLFTFYKAQKPATQCTLNDVVLLAVGKTVNDFPAFRSRIEGNEIVEWPNSNIGVAVSVEDGLVVPVILGIEGHTLASLPAESKRIVESSRKGRLENVGKGVFTISNMGMLGVENFSAIINPPESGILAVSAVREAVIVKDGAMRAGRVMSLTLSVDHRVVDGAMAATFMGKLKDRLEKPESLL